MISTHSGEEWSRGSLGNVGRLILLGRLGMLRVGIRNQQVVGSSPTAGSRQIRVVMPA